MSSNVTPFLLIHLRQAVRHEANEVRFVSGQQPSFKVGGRLRVGGEVLTSAELVQAMHEACLSKAKQQGNVNSPTTRYLVTLKEVGAFQCHFEVKGNTKSLFLYREPQQGEVVAHGKRVNPPLASEATEPNEEE